LVADKVERASLQFEVMRAIRGYLSPYHAAEAPLDANTVIADGTTVDSLTITDILMQLEERFDVSLSTKLMAEIRTIGELVDAVLAARRPTGHALA
jgi:acyl carrier protein